MVWDPDGTDVGVGIQIATFSNGFIPQASDFIVV
jgi:hypothetical protein